MVRELRGILAEKMTLKIAEKDSPKSMTKINKSQVNLKQMSMLDFVAYEAPPRGGGRT